MKGRLNFAFSEAVRSLSTNIATTAAATLTMFVALVVVGVFFVVLFVFQDFASTAEDQVGEVEVFLQSTATDKDVNALRSELEGAQYVESVTYVSEADALAHAKEIFKDNPRILENLAGNPFPPSLKAKLSDSSKAELVAQRMKGKPGVASVEDGGKEGKQIGAFARLVQWGSLVVAIFLTIAATALVANTIRLSIFARRREIEVMKLVGASNSFVRVPFMIEGLLCGVFAAVGAIVVLQVLGTFAGRVARQFNPINDIDVPVLGICAILLTMGMVLGAFGSGITIRRFLRI